MNAQELLEEPIIREDMMSIMHEYFLWVEVQEENNEEVSYKNFWKYKLKSNEGELNGKSII